MDNSLPLCFVILTTLLAAVTSNLEGDALNAWKQELNDPNNVLTSWDPTLVNPCTWFHVTCNNENSVTRIDLGNAGLSGPLVPQLGQLSNLQYLKVCGNNLSGAIPRQIGNLTSLIELDLHLNFLSGSIPASLGNLRSLAVMKLNGNNLSGVIPTKILQLVYFGHLRILDVSENALAGRANRTKSARAKKFAVTTIIQDPVA